MMNKIPYTVGLWVGKNVVAPFVDGVFDGVQPEIRPKVEKELREMLSDAIPDWFERLLKLRLV